MANEKPTCEFCGRPVRPRKGVKGRPKTHHNNCSHIMFLMTQLQARVEQTEWGDEAKLKMFQGELFALKNSLFNTKSKIVFSPDSDEEIEYVPPAKKRKDKTKTDETNTEQPEPEGDIS
jgi:hypothetical protein